MKKLEERTPWTAETLFPITERERKLLSRVHNSNNDSQYGAQIATVESAQLGLFRNDRELLVRLLMLPPDCLFKYL